jgi:hypothetical protein
VEVTVRRSDQFNVLDVEQVHAVARASVDGSWRRCSRGRYHRESAAIDT